jgi:hypothetical protein
MFAPTFAFLNLANPALLATGGALTAGPVIIHLLNKRRFKILEWAAMEFLLESLQRNRRRLQVEELILLILRMILLALLAFVVGKPLLEQLLPPEALGKSAAAAIDHFVVIDDSFSMGAVSGNKTAFDAARQRAIEIVEKLNDRPLDTLTVLRVSQFDAAVTDDTAGVPPAATDPAEKKTGPPPAKAPEPKKDAKADSKVPKDKPALTAAETIPDFLADVAYRSLQTAEDVKACLEIIRNLPLSDSGTRLDLAAAGCRKLVERAQNPNKRVYIISDFRERDTGRTPGRRGEAFREALKAYSFDSTRVRLIDVGTPDKSNTAITEFSILDATVVKGVESRFRVTVRNFGSYSVRGLKVALSDKTGRIKEVPVDRALEAAGAAEDKDRAVVYFDHVLPAEGPVGLYAELLLPEPTGAGDAVPDILSADNKAFLSLEVKSDLTVLLLHDPLTGKPGELETTHFLRRAVDFREVDLARQQGRSGVRRLTGVRAEERSPATIDAGRRLDLSQYNLVIVADVGSLETAGARGDRDRLVRDLEEYVQQGGSVVFFLGGRVKADFYNEHLYKGGRGLLPAKLDREIKEAGRHYRMRVEDGTHPVFREFKDSALTALLQHTVRFVSFWNVERGEGGKLPAGVKAPVVFDDAAGSAAVVEKNFGKGRVVCFLTGADKETGNWTLSPSFPIIMVDLVGYLARAAGPVRSDRVGTPLQAFVPEYLANGTVKLLGPAERAEPGKAARPAETVELGRLPVRAADGRQVVRVEFPWTDTGGVRRLPRAGFYRLDWSEDPQRRPGSPGEAVFARNFDETESDLSKSEETAKVIADFAEHTVTYHAAGGPESGEEKARLNPVEWESAERPGDKKTRSEADSALIYQLMAALLGLMLVEQFLAYKFSHHE